MKHPAHPFVALDPTAGALTLTQPNNVSLQITAQDSSAPIVTIHCDGRVELNPAFTLDEAARAFWDAVIRLNPNAERRKDTP